MPRHSAFPAFILAFVLLSAAFLLVGSARAAPLPALAPAPPGPDQQVAAAAPAAISCTNPPMGMHALLQDDAEISAVGLSDYFGVSYDEYNNPVGGTAVVHTRGSLGCDTNQNTACGDATGIGGGVADLYRSDPTMPAGMPIVALRDKNQALALGTIGANGVEETWWANGSGYAGTNLSSIDIATGDLNRAFVSPATDPYQEVILAFKDSKNALRLAVVRGDELSKPNTIDASYGGDTTNGRGSVNFVAVATGDLNGDGYKNEIVTAFKDGNKHLQVMVFNKASAGATTLNVLWAQAFTDHNRDNSRTKLS